MRRADIARLRPAIAALCAKYGLEELALFGSTARDEADTDSDVDLLYVRGPRAVQGLAFFGLQEELESLLHTKVDLVPKDNLNWVIRERVLNDAQVLYAA